MGRISTCGRCRHHRRRAELANYAASTCRSPQCLLNRLRRDQFGLALYPLAWVSHHWQQAITILADLERFPGRQVFRLRQLPDDLIGNRDAAEFNLNGGRRSSATRRSRRQRKPAIVFA